MKTTLNIDDTVMQRLREEAPKRGTTMSALVEAGIRHVLRDGPPATYTAGPPTPPALPTWHGGAMQVDVSNRDELYRVMEEEA